MDSVDAFSIVRDIEHRFNLKEAMENHSILKFTYELPINDKIPFLDVNVNTLLQHLLIKDQPIQNYTLTLQVNAQINTNLVLFQP